ncbi:MAG TPA: histidine kinase, partial [Acidimicrobiales bacterium]|nr:histidine kinase [Acidimicrobiales bacterium]
MATRTSTATGPGLAVPAVLVALAGAAGAVLGAADHGGAIWWVATVVTVAWAAATVLVARRLPDRPLALLMGLLTLAIGAALWTAAEVSAGNDAMELPRSVITALILGLALHLAFAVPDGRLPNRTARTTVAIGHLSAIGLGVAVGPETDLPTAPFALAALVTAAVGVLGYLARWRKASIADRARLQWIGWGAALAAAIGGLVVLLDALLDWPDRPGAVALAATVVVPAAFVATTFPRLLTVIDRVIVRTVVLVGLLALVEAVYLFVVVGLGRVPEAEERSILVLSMVAAGVCAVLAFPARHRLEEVANQRIYGERTRPDDAVKTFAGRMSRAVPMDELLLQLAESLKKSLTLTAAEVWTGQGGTLDRAVSVPDRPADRLVLAGEELGVATRAHVQGNAWLQIWVPGLLEGRRDVQVRAAVVAHLGELLGLIVVERKAEDPPFTDDDDRVLAELARQVGLALHNVRLDSALQASLEELELRNEELAASRLRIVSAADESRRQIERNLHDGAQQHLVALAVKVGLVKQLIDADRATAEEMLDQLRGDVQETLDELRELAHGIYPPLLRDRGLEAALNAAANRSRLPVELQVDEGVQRHPAETEAAIYFCVLEAMQNAGKHAGDDAHLIVRISESDGALRFEVEDDGPGFDATAAQMGHGFVNMRDRLGALGGTLEVDTAPGQG